MLIIILNLKLIHLLVIEKLTIVFKRRKLRRKRLNY